VDAGEPVPESQARPGHPRGRDPTHRGEPYSRPRDAGQLDPEDRDIRINESKWGAQGLQGPFKLCYK
jgi:hypothetical protein